MKIRISEFIGENYKDWNLGSTVILDAYTGSGKTYFVSNILLPYAIKKGKKIVYFCNRRALKEQTRKHQLDNKTIEIDGEKYLAKDYFYIIPYQYCETICKFPDFDIREDKLYSTKTPTKQNKPKKISISENEILYFIFDEAHYFVMDSSFNQKNSFWFEQNFQFKNSIALFLTATPEPFYLFYYFNQKKALLTEYLSRFVNAAEDINFFKKEIQRLNDKHLYTTDSEGKINECNLLIENNLRPQIYKKLISEINNILQTFTPQETTVSELLLLGENSVKIYSYFLKKDYSQYACYYFYEYDSLINRIIGSNEKWLIFVSSEADGKYLETIFNTIKAPKNGSSFSPIPYAVFLSAKTKNHSASMTYKTLVSKEKFDCEVLIATSVIDCGVNIKDETLNNIIISQPDKTEFSQMLGRLREKEDQKINLYIKVVTDDEKRKFSNRAKREIANAIAYETFKRYNDNIIKSNYHNEMEKEKLKLINDILANKLSYMFTFTKKTKQPYEKKCANIDLLQDLKINNSFLIYNLYKVWQYAQTSEECENENIPQESYLFKQLGWMNKKYISSNWVGYKEDREKIIEFIECFKNQGYLDSSTYERFKNELFLKILKLPLLLLPKRILKDISNYKKGRMPHLSTINSALVHLKFNYILKSKRSNGKKKWYIAHIEKDDE